MPFRPAEQSLPTVPTGCAIVILVTALPIIVYLVAGQPVELLKLRGNCSRTHPVVAARVLYLNRTKLPDALRPSTLTILITGAAAAFFAAFAIFYLTTLLTHSSAV